MIKKWLLKQLIGVFVAFSYKDKDKEALVAVFRMVFEKVTIDKTGVFFNFSGFLLSELYDPVSHKGDFVVFKMGCTSVRLNLRDS